MLRLRVGINTGVTTIGDIGARHRFNFKALGDVVNVAARLERLGKEIGPEGRHVVLLSGATRQDSGLPDSAVESLGERQLRGRETPVSVFRFVDS